MAPEGALLVDKPAGPTSHDVVQSVRRLLKERRCGHTGTLDPFATGLLILLVGRATRLARFLSETFKTYAAVVRFGFATDTYDGTGESVGAITERVPSRTDLERALASFVGVTQQQPPAFSAKRIDGKRAYQLAREGIAVAPAPVDVEIREIRLLDFDGPRARIETTVSSGTYIRSLAHDIGQSLGIGAHLEALRRIRIGSFRLEEAASLDALSGLAASGELETRIVPPEEVLRDLPLIRVDRRGAERLVHGQRVAWAEVQGSVPASASAVRVLGPEDDLVAVAEPPGTEGALRTVLVWARPRSGVGRSP